MLKFRQVPVAEKHNKLALKVLKRQKNVYFKKIYLYKNATGLIFT